MMFSAGSAQKAPWNEDALERDLVRERSLSAEQREHMWLELALRFQRPIDRALTGMGIASVHDREDLWQETLLHAFLRCAAYAPERGRIATWLRVIAREVARRWRRAHRLPAATRGVVDSRVASTAAECESRDFLENLLSNLKPREAAVLRDVYLGGLSTKQVAVKWGWTPKATERMLARARAKVRAQKCRVFH